MSAAKPKVRSIRWRPPAENSLLSIVDFIAEDKPEAAAVFAGQVRSAVASLATLPERVRAGRVATTRELVVHPNYVALLCVFQSLRYRFGFNVTEVFVARC